MATFSGPKHQEEEDDDFFGSGDGDDDDDGNERCLLAEQESKAISAQLSNVAYLDAFEDTKESRLQEGFESGYRDVFELALRLGCRLGGLSAESKFQELQRDPSQNSVGGNADAIRQATRRFRAVMDQINQGSSDNNEGAKVLLLDLEEEIDRLLKI